MRERKPGLWAAAILAFSTLVLFALLGCGVVQRVAEPIDKAGCKADCKLENMEFHAYDYAHHACECEDADGEVVEIYRLIEE